MLGGVKIFPPLWGGAPFLFWEGVMRGLFFPRRKKLVERVKGLQCILTCTHAERLLYGAECNKIKISGGKIV